VSGGGGRHLGERPVVIYPPGWLEAVRRETREELEERGIREVEPGAGDRARPATWVILPLALLVWAAAVELVAGLVWWWS